MEDKRLSKRKQFLETNTDRRNEREKFMVSLRKKHKQKIFNQKRKLRFSTEEAKNHEGVYEDGFQQEMSEIEPRLYENTLLEERVKLVFANLTAKDMDPKYYLLHLGYLRRASVNHAEEILQAIVDNGLLPNLSAYLVVVESDDWVHEITWLLVNLSSVKNEEYLDRFMNIEVGLIKYLKELMEEYTIQSKIVECILYICNNLWSEDKYVGDILDAGYLYYLK